MGRHLASGRCRRGARRIGIRNFTVLFNNGAFSQALINNGLIIVVSLLLQIPLAIWLATMLAHKIAGVVTFRDLDDVEQMVSAADAGGEAVVIGGGLLGLEAAYGLAKRGMKATVVHLMDVLMERQLDSAAGFLLTQALIDAMKNSQQIAQFGATFGPFIIAILSGSGDAATLAFFLELHTEAQ